MNSITESHFLLFSAEVNNQINNIFLGKNPVKNKVY